MQQKKVHLLDTETFQDTFGPKKKRRRPKLAVDDFEALVQKVEQVRGFGFLFRTFGIGRSGHSRGGQFELGQSGLVCSSHVIVLILRPDCRVRERDKES